MKQLNDIIQPIADELRQSEVFFEQTLHSGTEPMNSILRYTKETQGKRLRPILVLLSARLFGTPNERTYRATAFVEMMHCATLMHDDVVDGDDRRRGHASVQARFGSLSAVLAGDYLLAKAVMLLSQPDDQAMLHEMLSAAAAMSEGELMQSSQSGDYLSIIIHKTASLMRACCAAGALSVNASPQQVSRIGDFGLRFGILFQLRDDILDGENTTMAQSLLPIYQTQAAQALDGFAESDTLTCLRALTEYCAGRKE